MNFILISPEVSISPTISPSSDGVVWIFALSAVNTFLSSLYKITSDICVLLLFGFLTWIKNVAYLVLIAKSKNWLKDDAVLENNLLISSISKTLFVLHSIYGDNFVFFNLRNFDLPPKVSTSRAKSKLLIVSTLFWSIKSSARTSVKLDVVTPALVVDVMPTSAKFLRPEVWSNLFTGLIKSSYVIGLLTL